MTAVRAIPEGYPRVAPYLCVDGAAKAIDFYCSVLGARERGQRMTAPDGTVGHAELEIGDSLIMISDQTPDGMFRAPSSVGGTPVTLHLYVESVDDVFRRALEAGAKELQPVKDQFYGDRSGTFEDPWGHRWNVASHVEDVAPEEMQRRAAEMMAGGG
jgi:PhnB protein